MSPRVEMKPQATHVVHVAQGARSGGSRRAPTFYTRIVILSRSFLWVVLAGIVGIVIWIAADNSDDKGGRLVFSGVTTNELSQNVMENPRYQGVDSKNSPYTVMADKAVQKDKDTVVLDNVRAEMTQHDGKWLALNSGEGELNTTTKKMLLTGGVDMFYSGGFEFRSDHAQVDIKEGSAYGDAPVEGQGPPGTLTAKSFEVSQRGQVIRFNGSVRMKLYR